MRVLPVTSYPEQSQSLSQTPQPPTSIDPTPHHDRVMQELKGLGMIWKGSLRSLNRDVWSTGQEAHSD